MQETLAADQQAKDVAKDARGAAVFEQEQVAEVNDLFTFPPFRCSSDRLAEEEARI